MPALKVVIVFAVAALLGLGVRLATDAVAAGYVVAVLAMATGCAILALTMGRPTAAGGRVRSKIRFRGSKNAVVTGVALRRAPKDIDSSIRTGDIDGGEVTGVREE